jgi:putative SOS response-associated peptidase YedK
VVLTGDALDRWLDPAIEDPDDLRPLLAPFPARALETYAVAPFVNSPRNDSPECVAAPHSATSRT